jgi:hypothetical protein
MVFSALPVLGGVVSSCLLHEEKRRQNPQIPVISAMLLAFDFI